MMVSTKKHEYMINLWWSGNNNGTTPLFRTTDRSAWIKKIQELIPLYRITEKWSRVVEREDITVFSFPERVSMRLTWQFAEFSLRPKKAYYGFPEGVEV